MTNLFKSPVKVLNLTPRGTYFEGKGYSKIETPNILYQKHGRIEHAHRLIQGPIFPMETPKRYTSWEEFIESPARPPMYNSSKQLMIVDAQNRYPLSPNEQLDQEDLVLIGKGGYEEMFQIGQNHAALEDAGLGMRKMTFFLIASAFAFFSLIFGFMTVQSVWFDEPDPVRAPIAPIQPAAPGAIGPPTEPVAPDGPLDPLPAGKVLQEGVDLTRLLGFGVMVLGMVSISMPRPWLPFSRGFSSFRAQRRVKKALGPFETLIVVEHPKPRAVQLPKSELRVHMDPRSRFVPDTFWPRIVAMLGATTAVALPAYFAYFSIILLPTGALIFTALVAILTGAPVGWWIGPKFGPKPIWICRRSFSEIDGEPDAMGVEVESYLHGHFRPSVMTEVYFEDENGKRQKDLVPRVELATTLAVNLTAQDEKEELKNQARVNWDKIETGLIAVMAICSAGLLFLFATAQK